MRILMLAPHPAIHNGIVKLMPLLVSALRGLGCDVTLEPWGRRSEREPIHQKIAQRITDIRRVRDILRHRRFDVLVVHTAHDWAALSRDIPLLLATRRAGCRAVLQFHGSWADRLVAPGHLSLKLASVVLLRLADGALVLSSEERRQWQAFYPRGRFYQVLNPFLAPTRRDPLPDRRSFGLPANDPVVLFVGRLMQEKGIRELVDILPRVMQHVPFHLLIAGEGPLQRELVERAARVGVADRLTLLGYLQGEALQAAYDCADLFALPTAWAEGFPLAIVEAMDAGLPIVTTPIRGMADHLREGVNALFVPPHDATALASAVTRLLRDPELRARMGQANHQKVREFCPDVVGPQYLDLLREMLGASPPEASPRRRGMHVGLGADLPDEDRHAGPAPR
jgi:glycosyltransferase involved in cell wall biosynthesis